MSPASPCPEVQVGVMLRTRQPPTGVVCKAYSAPPGDGGHYLQSLEKGALIGPVEEVVWQRGFVSVRIGLGWVNVYKERLGRPGVHFAFVEP